MRLELAQVLYLFAPAYAADLAPVVAKVFWPGFSRPIDGERRWRGQPIFGSHKTWRGVIAGTAAGMAIYELQVGAHAAGWFRGLALVDYEAHAVLPGLLMAVGALLGDLVKSFFKRRGGIRPGGTWLPFDQLDFFAGATLFVGATVRLPVGAWLAALPIVFACDVAACAIGYVFGFKDDWI